VPYKFSYLLTYKYKDWTNKVIRQGLDQQGQRLDLQGQGMD